MKSVLSNVISKYVSVYHGYRNRNSIRIIHMPRKQFVILRPCSWYFETYWLSPCMQASSKYQFSKLFAKGMLKTQYTTVHNTG